MNKDNCTDGCELTEIDLPYVPLEITDDVKPTLLHGSHFGNTSSDQSGVCSPSSSPDANMSSEIISFYPGSNTNIDSSPYSDFYNSDLNSLPCSSSSFNNNKLSDEDLKTAKYITSFRGNRLVACKDYIYRRKMARAGKTYWSCINNDCMAKLHVTTGSEPPEVLCQQGEHIHPAEYGATAAREAMNMYVVFYSF